MIPFGPAQCYYLYREATDMRKSFDGLSGLVTSALGRDPLSGEVFVFINRRRTHLKLLVWDRSGFVLYYKRLEAGTFERLATSDDGCHLQLDATELSMLLSGVSLAQARKRRKRFAAS